MSPGAAVLGSGTVGQNVRVKDEDRSRRVSRNERKKLKKRSEDEELQEFTPCLVKGLNVFVFKLALASLGSS